MGIGVGYGYVMGAAIEASHATASGGMRYGAVASDRIPVLSDSLAETVNWIESDVLNGQAGRQQTDLGTFKIGGGVETEVRYAHKNGNYFHDNHLLMAAACGTAAFTSGAASDAFSSWSQLTLVNSPSRYLTLAAQKTGEVVWNWISMMPKSMELSGVAGGFMKTNFDFAGYRLCRGSGAAATGSAASNFPNGTAQIGSLTAVGGLRVLFNDLTFRIGTFASTTAAATAGSAFLTSAGNIGLADFKMMLNGNIEDGVYSTPDANSGHGVATNPLLPIRTGFRTVDLEFTLPRYETGGTGSWGQQLESWKLAQTSLALVGYTSINSGSHQFAMKFPKIVIQDIQIPVGGPDVDKIKVKAKAYRGASDNGSMPMILASNASVTSGAYITEEFAIEMRNSSSDGRAAVIW